MIYIVFLIFTGLVLVFALYQLQYFMIFTPTYFRDGEFDENFEILSITTDDGVELEGVVFTPKNPKNTILFFAGRTQDSVGLIKRLATIYSDSRIITFNYRSYGRSAGVINEKNMFFDGVYIANIIQKNYGDFYLLGFSIGSVIASNIATQIKTKALVLVGSFDSVTHLLQAKYPFVPSWFIKYKFNNSVLVQNVDSPTHLFVSTDDEITYIQNARDLKSCVKNLKTYKEFDNLKHKELLWDNDVISEIKQVIN